MNNILSIIFACLGSGGLFTFLQFVISRKDKRAKQIDTAFKRLEEVDAKLAKLEQSIIRTQLLLLIQAYPNNRQEILKVGEYYFQTLKGDWYLTDIFKDWAKEHDIDYLPYMDLRR